MQYLFLIFLGKDAIDILINFIQIAKLSINWTLSLCKKFLLDITLVLMCLFPHAWSYLCFFSFFLLRKGRIHNPIPFHLFINLNSVFILLASYLVKWPQSIYWCPCFDGCFKPVLYKLNLSFNFCTVSPKYWSEHLQQIIKHIALGEW